MVVRGLKVLMCNRKLDKRYKVQEKGQVQSSTSPSHCDTAEYLCVPTFIGWNPISSEVVLGVGAFERWLHHDSRVLLNRISALAKQLPQPSWYGTTQREDSHLWTRTQVLTRYKICWHLDLRLTSLQNCEKFISVLYKPLNILLQQPEQTKTQSQRGGHLSYGLGLNL